MPKIGRPKYHEAMEKIFSKMGCQCASLSLGNLLIQKNNRKILVNIAGKNLPYFGSSGKQAFPWETYIDPRRLDKIEKEAKKHKAEPWLGFCYAILDQKYSKYFDCIVTIGKQSFGAKLITTSRFRENMKPRSPSWVVVDIPRKQVLSLTLNPANI